VARSGAGVLALCAAVALSAAAAVIGGMPDFRPALASPPQYLADPSPLPTLSATPSPAIVPSLAPPQPIYPPSPCPSEGCPSPSPCPSGCSPAPEASPAVPPSPVPVQVNPDSLLILLGHSQTARLLSPPSGLVTFSGYDDAIVRPVFNPLNRSVEVFGLHTGATKIVVTDMYGLNATLSAKVEVSAGKAYDWTSISITGHPATADFVAEMAASAARRVAYPLAGAVVSADPSGVQDALELQPDQTSIVRVPLEIAGFGYFNFSTTVRVRVTNLAQPRVAPKYMLVSDFPETITEDGTLFYGQVNFGEPARLLYYHYAPPGAPKRRILVKVQNNGTDSVLLDLTTGLAGPYTDILGVGHECTRRYLVHDALGEGEIYEVPPQATINVVDQPLPADNLIAGLMQMRVISGNGVRIAVVVQAADASPVDPISETLLSSAVKHSRGIYQVPEFFYDEAYTVGDQPTYLEIGKLPLPNLVQGEVLGGDYGVKQSADVSLLNPTGQAADVGLWFEPRGGRATGTLLVDDAVVQLHPVEARKMALVRRFNVPAHGYRHVSIVTMPEGGSSYPVNLLFASDPPPGAGWNISPAVH